MSHLTFGHFGRRPRPDDRFGTAVLVADISGGPGNELIVAAPNAARYRGRVAIMGDVGSSIIAQPGDREPGDRFGLALAAADWTGDTRTDLAVAAPNENRRSGIVSLFENRAVGLEPLLNLRQGGDNSDQPEEGDRFGSTLD